MVKNKKIIFKFRLFKLVLIPNFSLNWQFWFFWPDFPKKGFSSLKQKKWTPHSFYIILYILFILVRNLCSNWQLWFFGPNLPKKVFPVKKANIIIGFRIFKLVLVLNFCLNWQFWFFWPDLPKKCFSRLKQKKLTPHIFLHNSAYSN